MSAEVAESRPRTLSQQVGKEIKVVLLRRDMSGRQLASMLGESQTWLSSRLAGSTPIDLNDLERIAKALGVSVQSLLPKDGPERVLTIPGSPESPVIRTADRPHVATIMSPRGSAATPIHRPRRRPGRRDASPEFAAAGMVTQ